MKNCLITKLDATVNNKNLPYLGGLLFVVNSPSATSIDVLGGKEYEYISIDDVPISFSDSAETFTKTKRTGGATLSLPAGKYRVVVRSKYDITQLSGGPNVEFDCSQLDRFGANTSNSVLYLDNFKKNGVISGFINSSYMQFCYDGSKYLNDNSILDLNNTTFNSNLSAIFKKGGDTIGTIENLTSYSSLSSLYFKSGSSVTGEIDTLAQALVSAGRASGALSIGCVGTKITDEGHECTQSYLNSKKGSNDASTVKVTFDPAVTGGYTKSYI